MVELAENIIEEKISNVATVGESGEAKLNDETEKLEKTTPKKVAVKKEASESANEVRAKNKTPRESKPANKSRKTGTKDYRRKRQDTAKIQRYPVAPVEVTIDHYTCQVAFTRYFGSFCQAFYTSCSILERCGLERHVDEVTSHIESLIDGVMEEMSAAKAALEAQMIAKGGPEKCPRMSTSPKIENGGAPFYGARKYIALWPEADRLIDAISMSESLGIINWSERGKLLSGVQGYLRSPCGRFQSISKTIRAKSRAIQVKNDEATERMREALKECMDKHKAMKPVQVKHPIASLVIGKR